MKIFKKVILSLSVLVLCFFFFGVINNDVKADAVATSSEISVVGAGIRTTGNAGLRFVGHIGNYDTTNVKAYGIAIAYGDADVNNIVIGGTVGGKSVLNTTDASGLDAENNFYVVIYNVPNTKYGQNVTARAYVVLNNDTVVYGTAATTRSIYQVAKAAKEDPNYVANDFINNLVSTAEFTVVYYPNGGTISDNTFSKYYPAASSSLTAGYYGTTGYWQGAYQSTTIFLVSKAQFQADTGNSYAYTYRVGFTYDSSIGEYKVDQIITGSGSGVVSIHNTNTSDYYFMVKTDNAGGLASLKNFAVGDVVTIEGGVSGLVAGAISKAVNRYANYQLAYKKDYVLGQNNVMPTPTKSLNDFVKWVDGSDVTVTALTGAVTVYAVWEPVYEMRYYTNGGSLEGTYTRTPYTELSETPIYEAQLAFSNGGYYSYYNSNVCFYTQAGASDGFTYARKIGLNYNETYDAYEIVQNIAGGTAFNSTNRTSQYYLLIGDDYALGKSWGSSLQVGKYLVFSANITAISGCNNRLYVNEYGVVNKEICVKKDSGLVTLPTPTRDGYIFDGWYENADFSGSPITQYNLNDSYKCVYAKWHMPVYTVKMVANNGSNKTGSYNALSSDGLTVTYNALGSGETTANGYVAFRCYKDGVEMAMGPSLWTLTSSNNSVISAYSSYSCVGLVKAAGTVTMTLTNKADTNIVIKCTVTVVDGTN